MHSWTLSACSLFLCCIKSGSFLKTFSQRWHLISFLVLSEPPLWRNRQRLSPNSQFPEEKFQQIFTLSLCCSFLCYIIILLVWKVSVQKFQTCSVCLSFEHTSVGFKLSLCFCWWYSRSDSDLHHFPHISQGKSVSKYGSVETACSSLICQLNSSSHVAL